MHQIFKSSFIFKRIADKSIKKIENFLDFYLSKFKSTYSIKYIDNITISPIYSAESIRYDILDKDKILNHAENILKHNFNLLGSGKVNISYDTEYKGFENILYNNILIPKSLTELAVYLINKSNLTESINFVSKISENYKPIDWQRDYRSGYRWKNDTFYSKVRYGSIKGVDIKHTWELGRLAHFVILFYALNITKNEKYLLEFKNQIYDFMAFNPPLYGVQWAMPMDTALRAVNLTAVYSLFVTSGVKFDSDFERDICNYLYSHLVFLLNNLEWSSGRRANHYLANICGIIYLAVFLPKNDDTEFALNLALNEFTKECFYQFNDEGGNFEASLPYHNFASEMVMQTYIMIKQHFENNSQLVNILNRKECNKFRIHKEIVNRNKSVNPLLINYKSKLRFSDEFEIQIKKIAAFTVNSLTPQVTDYLIGDNDDGCFFRFIPLYNEENAINIKNRLELQKISAYLSENSIIESKFYPVTGFCFYNFKNYSMCIRCGNVGQNGKGGHSHNDQLSFELYFRGKLIICDSGTYNYTAFPDKRNLYRSTRSHNTMVVGLFEQNPIDFKSKEMLFWMEDKSKAKIIHFDKNKFEGVHFGYPKPHKREMTFEENSISGIDKCDIKIDKKLVFFHLTPNAEIINKSESALEIECEGVKFALETENSHLSIVDYEYSPSYGVKYISKLIVISSFENVINWKISFIN